MSIIYDVKEERAPSRGSGIHLTFPLCTIAVLPKLCRDHLCLSLQRLRTKQSKLHNFRVCLGPLQPGSASFALYQMLNLPTLPPRGQ